MKTAVIIIGQDSDSSLSLAARALSDVCDAVAIADLQNIGESLETATSRFSEASGIVILPYALELSEGHLRPLEAALKRLRTAHPDRDIRLAPQIGFDRRLVEIMQDRIRTATNESSIGANLPIITVELPDAGVRAFGLDDLAALPGRIDDIGAVVPDRSGEAVPVGAVLDAAGATATAGTATFRSGDEFSADVDLRIVRERGWLVFRLDGAPLPARYGGPVRLFIPEFDDRCANVKSVDRIVVA